MNKELLELWQAKILKESRERWERLQKEFNQHARNN
jgi:hypothetical protein